MKFTNYFKFTRARPDRAEIKYEWITKAFFEPIFQELQKDGRIRRWAKIEEAKGKYLRIVILEDSETIHNAFFDRSFKEKK
jgi:hypothetical protein